MDKDSHMTTSVDGSGDMCILCLDGVDENTIWFPSIYSSCGCKYALHLYCIKDNRIDECVICKSEITYPIPIELIELGTFDKIARTGGVCDGNHFLQHPRESQVTKLYGASLERDCGHDGCKIVTTTSDADMNDIFVPPPPPQMNRRCKNITLVFVTLMGLLFVGGFVFIWYVGLSSW
jgi:hypothetical protein